MERSSFFNAMLNGTTYDRVYKAEDFARYFSSFIGNGVYASPISNLQVLSVDNDMNIRVQPGRAWINGYFYENTDELIFTVGPADGVLHRIDRVVVRWDLVNREIITAIKRGTPGSVPTAPTLERTDEIYELALADIRINAGAIRINQSDITDQRYVTNLCGIVAGVVSQIDTTGLFSQFEDEFTSWFNGIKGQLGADVAGSLQNQINQHTSIPHVTYREVTPITKIDVLSSDNNEAILTDDDQVILPTGITRDSDNTRDTVVSGVKIPDLPTVTPNDDDLVLLESKNGTSSTKVSELLKPVNTEINVIKNESMKYTEI